MTTLTRTGGKVMKGSFSATLARGKQKLGDRTRALMIERGLLLFLVAFLLGRAVVLSSVSPFALAFLAAVWLMRKERSINVTIAAVAGAVTISISQGVFVLTASVTFFVIAFLFQRIQAQQRLLPVYVFLASFIPRLVYFYFVDGVETYALVMSGVEAGLSSILVLIFMQSVPLLSPKRITKTLKNEEIICMIILLASILTGTIGWQVYDISVEQVLSRYLVLGLAFIGGAAIGATVGVVTGLILSLANVADLNQMSLLAFSGLLGGLLKEGRKLGVGAGLFVATLLIGIYGDGMEALGPSMIETSVAVLLFFVTPESWIRKMARYIPGTSEHSEEQAQYLQKVRDATASRVEQFSSVFQALSNSFDRAQWQMDEDEQTKETDFFLSNVTEKTCQSCFRKDKCWAQCFDETYGYMQELMTELDEGTFKPRRKLHNDFDRHCVKSDKVIEAMKGELSFYQANQQLKKQVKESRQFVADQLRGVSAVMDDFAKEILKERVNHEQQEEAISSALKSMGFEIEKLDIFSLDPGSVDIEMTLSFYDYKGEGAKIVAPVLSDILNETIVVKHEEVSPFPNGYCQFSFSSSQKYKVDSGVSHAAKDGGFISGDSYSLIELGAGKHAVAISDGMGNGERAHIESTETLRLLQQILQTGIDEEVAIKSINSILSLRTMDEIFSTLDLAVVDLNDAAVKFLKIGSTPSYIKRGDQLIKIEASNLPMGIITDFDVDVVSEQLKPGDLLIMMSDGIFDGPKHVENIDMWLRRKIREMRTEDPQDVADLLLEEVIRTRSGRIEDDMTVLVTKIDHNVPRWAAIPLYGQQAQ
ncbi:stage II sporulation protein E [Pontibacillus halophilus JSM 076056 = DSM 19796]|uniref:Stage II sporulation protein E n=1 Tax=Pontibacillus halophilus JSM 076056 = DSM 19796 TaxID=1385510 RepID=A0A0A5GDM1_9BACI|nr:stage II sporulation protein E [Pontibacillus halophilus]KGX90069.1 stage II sporulation protein E [Pontibacillus halophilus JSM 076056 = DSM 19796]